METLKVMHSPGGAVRVAQNHISENSFHQTPVYFLLQEAECEVCH